MTASLYDSSRRRSAASRFASASVSQSRYFTCYNRTVGCPLTGERIIHLRRMMILPDAAGGGGPRRRRARPRFSIAAPVIAQVTPGLAQNPSPR
jgi:hypothetical protein